jgi:hypothetical protein
LLTSLEIRKVVRPELLLLLALIGARSNNLDDLAFHQRVGYSQVFIKRG